jgi:hypothetical protein
MPHTAVCILSRYYSETWIEFLNTFDSTVYDVFFVIDDMAKMYPENIKQVNIIQIQENRCRETNYYNSSSASNLKDILAWDKALYYFNRVSELKYDHIWFLEEDVFLMSENVFRTVDAKYPESDLLSAFHEINETGNIYNGWNHWINVIHRIGTPWAHSLISASRLSRRLLDRIDDYVQDRPLMFIEALFNTLALQNHYSVQNPDEMRYTITYDNQWNREQVDISCLYHPLKKIEDHIYIREQEKKNKQSEQ